MRNFRRKKITSIKLQWKSMRHARVFVMYVLPILCVCLSVTAVSAQGQNNPNGVRIQDSDPQNNTNEGSLQGKASSGLPSGLPGGIDVDQMLSPGGMSSTLKLMLLLTVLSLAPSILIMTTCFIRFVIVLGLLRQALGTQQLPPNQVIISLCLFLTFTIMAPVWKQSYEQGIKPYTNNEPIPGLQAGEDPLERAFLNAAEPIRDFMSSQIEATGNSSAVWMLLKYQNPEMTDEDLPQSYDEVPLSVLLPAYMLSEMKTAFMIGFQIFLPFLIIDMVISSLLISMGMMMLPPVLISLPFKLLLFVMIDGWALTVGMLLESVVQAT